MTALLRHAVNALARGVHRLRRRVMGPSSGFGVRAVAITPEGKVVLVRHRYVRGWYLPGGGRKPGETSEVAVRRELREEIGMTGCSALLAAETGGADGEASLFVAHGVRHRPPRWSLEIDRVAAFDPGDLPPDTTPRSRRDIARALGNDAAPLPGGEAAISRS